MSNSKTKKGSKKSNYKIKTCSDGSICSNLCNSDDVPTKVSSLGYRFIFTLISCAFIGYSIDDGRSFFSSTFMFSLPLILDYLRFEPRSFFRKLLRFSGLFFTAGEAFISVLGLRGIFEVRSVSNKLLVTVSEKFIILQGKEFELKYLWFVLTVSVFITALDWAVYRRKLEDQLMGAKPAYANS